MPEDGLPVLDGWLGCYDSMVFSGVERAREPLDICALALGTDPPWITLTISGHSQADLAPGRWRNMIVCLYGLWFSLSFDLAGAQMKPGPLSLKIVKGFTKMPCAMFNLLASADLDLSSPDAMEKLILVPVLDRGWMIPVHAPCQHVFSWFCLSRYSH